MSVEASLSILSSILSIAVSVKEWMTQKDVTAETAAAQLADRGDNATREALAQTDIREAVLALMVISKDLLEQLEREAIACEKKHIRARKAADEHIDKQQADIKAGQCMCGVLRDIKRYNGRQLPNSDQIKRFWSSYDCED